MMLKPIGGRLVVTPIKEEGVTTSGIFLPETAKEKPQQGKVIAVGPGELSKEHGRLPMDVHVDDHILFARYAGTSIKLHGEEYLILHEKDVLAIIEK